MRDLFCVCAATAIATSALLGGCALLSDYDFGSYERAEAGGGGAEPTGTGGAPGATTSSSSGGDGGAGGQGGQGEGGGQGGQGGEGGSGPVLTVYYTGKKRPVSLAVDPTGVYWATSGDPTMPDGTIHQADKGGGTPLLLASGQTSPSAVSLDLTHVYWFTKIETTGAIHRVQKNRGAVETLTAVGDIIGFAVQLPLAYWTESQDTISRISTNGGTPEVIVPAQEGATQIAVDETGIYWTIVGGAGSSDSAVRRANLDGSGVTTIATQQPFPLALTTDFTRVYWSTLNGGVFSVDKAGGEVEAHVTPVVNVSPCNDVAVDATHIYYTQGQAVRRIAFGSTMPETVVSLKQVTQEVAVDEASVYFTTFASSVPTDGGSVLKVDK